MWEASTNPNKDAPFALLIAFDSYDNYDSLELLLDPETALRPLSIECVQSSH
jgi:hypothetical protein